MDINNYTPKYSGLTGRHFLSIADFSPEEIYEILHTARLLKMKNNVGERQTSLLGKEIMLITKNAFSATRIAQEIAVKQKHIIKNNAIIFFTKYYLAKIIFKIY